MKKALSLLLVFAMLLGMIPPQTATKDRISRSFIMSGKFFLTYVLFLRRKSDILSRVN
jgi:hypothetical protein